MGKRYKIFGIGGPRTGTTSLGRALRLLGYTHKGWDPILYDLYLDGNLAAVLEAAEQYESFQDGPWNMEDFYIELDRNFPGSKFILTIRDVDSWSQSHFKFFSADQKPSIDKKYWIHSYNVKMETEKYALRNDRIINYFNGRDDFLVLNICNGDGWQKLCSFLGDHVPKQPFPWANKSK